MDKIYQDSKNSVAAKLSEVGGSNIKEDTEYELLRFGKNSEAEVAALLKNSLKITKEKINNSNADISMDLYREYERNKDKLTEKAQR